MYSQTQPSLVPPPPPLPSISTADGNKAPTMRQAPSRSNMRVAPPTVHRPSELFFAPSAGEVHNPMGLYSRIPVTAPSAGPSTTSSRSTSARPASSYHSPVHSSSVSSYFGPSTSSSSSSSASPGSVEYSPNGIAMPRRSSSPPLMQQQASPPAPTRNYRAMSSADSHPYYPRHSSSSSPAMAFSPPPMPSGGSSGKMVPPAPADEHERELKKVLEMSKEEANAIERLEEEQLKMALEESSKISSPTSRSVMYPTPVERTQSESSFVEPTMAFPMPQLPTTVYEEPSSFTALPIASSSSHDPSWDSKFKNMQISDDEAFARRLMQEEEERAAASSSHSTPDTPTLPTHTSAPAMSAASSSSRPSQDVLSMPLARQDTTVSVALPTYTESTSPPPVDSRPARPPTPPVSPPSPAPAPVEKIEEVEAEPPKPTESNLGNVAVNMNHYVDRDLLRGVSIGFMPPAVPLSTGLEPMQGVMPNIISLPYGRCPPLHLQAPSWRHLLKLTAWLSGTRMEPTMEAIESNKTEEAMKLRVVIQFIRPHPVSNDWRTILWFTIDHSPPHRRKSTSVDELPYSYSLSSPLPALLQDSADTAISKLYTIPESEGLQFPPLPITFPSLATYLQASLVESRRHASSDPSGLGKLSKMVDTCFPESAAPHESSGRLAIGGRVGGLFKRVKYIGRSGQLSGNSRRGAGNEDTYEMVTPFVPDQWQ